MLKVVSSNAQCVLAVTEIISDFSSISLSSVHFMYAMQVLKSIHTAQLLLVTKNSSRKNSTLQKN